MHCNRFTGKRTLAISILTALLVVIWFVQPADPSHYRGGNFSTKLSLLSEGDTVRAVLTLANQGDTSASTDFGVYVVGAAPPDCGDSGDFRGKVTLGADEVITATFKLPPIPAGPFTSHAFIDSNCLIDEEDGESNNVDSATILVDPAHDVSITDVRLVTQAAQGVTVPVNFDLENQGNVFENVEVRLKDGPTIKASQILPLPPFGKVTTDLLLDTSPPFAQGAHTITVEAVQVPGETDTGDNFRSAPISVVPPGAFIGDFVWHDLNENGLQEAGEPGIPNVKVELEHSDDGIVATTYTDFFGQYFVTGLSAGDYRPHFIAPLGFTFSPQDQGSDALDSDADELTGAGPFTNLTAGAQVVTVDAGLRRTFVRDLSSDQSVTVDGTDVDLNAMIFFNCCEVETPEISAWFNRETAPTCGAADADFSITIPIAPGSDETIDLSLEGGPGGNHTAYIFADSQCSIPEIDDANNIKAIASQVIKGEIIFDLGTGTAAEGSTSHSVDVRLKVAPAGAALPLAVSADVTDDGLGRLPALTTTGRSALRPSYSAPVRWMVQSRR